MFVASQGGVNYVLGVIGAEKLATGFRSERQRHGVVKDCDGTAPAQPAGVGRRAGLHGLKQFGGGGFLARARARARWFDFCWPGTRPYGRELTSPPWMAASHYADQKWLAPAWMGDTIYYTQMYAARYGSALDVARRMAVEHPSLLQRVLAWQSAVYSQTSLPVWLRDSLVNNLCLITEVSCWAQAKPPLGDYAFPERGFRLDREPARQSRTWEIFPATGTGICLLCTSSRTWRSRI